MLVGEEDISRPNTVEHAKIAEIQLLTPPQYPGIML